MRSGFSEKYETVGKPLRHKSLVTMLDKAKKIEGEVFSQNSVILFNSDYLDVLGSWYFFKSGLIFALLALAIISIAMMPLSVLLALHFFKQNILQGIASLSILIMFVGLASTFLYLIRRDFFHYTYYPIRFDRNQRRVYVTEANKTVSSYDWDDLVVTINNPAKNFCYVRLSVLDNNHIVQRTFSLPYISSEGMTKGLLGHWEFFRSYMEDETPEKSYEAIKEFYNIHGRKEKFIEICYACIMVDRDTEDNLESTEYDQLAVRLATNSFSNLFLEFFSEIYK